MNIYGIMLRLVNEGNMMGTIVQVGNCRVYVPGLRFVSWKLVLNYVLTEMQNSSWYISIC